MEISINEYARRNGVTRNSVYQKIANGTLPARKVAKIWLIEESVPYKKYTRPRSQDGAKSLGGGMIRPEMEQRILLEGKAKGRVYEYEYCRNEYHAYIRRRKISGGEWEIVQYY